MNGIEVQYPLWPNASAQAVRVSVYATDGTYMIIKKWSFPQTGSNPNPLYNTGLPYPFPYLMKLGWQDFMFPALASYGDPTNGYGLAGQNSPDPSEKVFGSHFIVKVQGSLTPPSTPGPYFDPSYGRWYTDPTDFEKNAVAGYMWFPLPPPQTNQAPSFFEARRLGGGVGVNITLVP